jgi:ParB/RepB/Spo0J family partition protein
MTDKVDGNTTPEQTAAVVSDKIAKRGLHKIEKKTSKLERLEVEYVEINSIKPNTYNPNRQDDETLNLLKRSITEDGFTQPIVCHKQSRQIVDGEHRWRAARDLGMEQIPVVFVEMTDAQMRIATLRHNRARGSEDIDLGNEVLRDLQRLGALDWAKDSLQLSDKELNELLAEDEEVMSALADEGGEFSDAWVPERGDGESDGEGEATTDLQERHEEGKLGVQGIAMTASAAREATERKEAMARAQTERERSQIAQKASRPFRIGFKFTGEEAVVVKAALGDKPAENLLVICTEIEQQEKTE